MGALEGRTGAGWGPSGKVLGWFPVSQKASEIRRALWQRGGDRPPTAGGETSRKATRSLAIGPGLSSWDLDAKLWKRTKNRPGGSGSKQPTREHQMTVALCVLMCTCMNLGLMGPILPSRSPCIAQYHPGNRRAEQSMILLLIRVAPGLRNGVT